MKKEYSPSCICVLFCALWPMAAGADSISGVTSPVDPSNQLDYLMSSLTTGSAMLSPSLPAASTNVPGISTDPVTANITLNIGTTTITASGILDTGATAEPGNVVPNSSNIPVPTGSIDRATATQLGLIDKDGNLVASMFEQNSKGQILTVPTTIGDGTTDTTTNAVTKPISITIKDSNGTATTIQLRLTVSSDPNHPGSNVIGDDFLHQAAVTLTYSKTPGKVTYTWNNPELSVPGAKKGSEANPPGNSGSFIRGSWTGVSFASLSATVTGPADLLFESPVTFLSQQTVSALGLTPVGTYDLSGNPGLLDDLERYGFYAGSASDFGTFDEVVLPSLSVATDDGSVAAWTDLPVLVDPLGNANVLGYDLFSSDGGTLDGVPLASITVIGSTGDTFFTPVPEPGAWQMLLIGSSLVAMARRARSDNRR